MGKSPDTAPAASQELVVQRPRPLVENAQPLFDTDRFEHFQRAATALMHSTLLPESVRGTTPQQCFSNLMLVFDLSDRWKVPALSIAQCIAIVHNKVVYEGKLIAAMLDASLGVQLQYHYTGERGTDGYRVYVWDQDFATLTDEELAALAPGRYPRNARMIDGAVSDWKTYQKDGRTPNPAWTGAAQRNQLSYRGAREWTRLYEPGKLLGVYGEDEIDAIQDRRDERAAIAGPGGINAGFTRPAGPTPGDVVAAGPIIDAEVSEAAGEAQDAQGAPAAPVAPADPAQATQAPAQAQGDAKPAAKPKADPAAKEAARQAKVQEETAARLAKCAAVEEQGRLDGLAGEPGKPPEGCTDEEARYYANGYAIGAEERERGETSDADPDGLEEDAYAAGHVVGLAGGDLEVPKAWKAQADAWTQGYHGGAAERLEDASDQDDEGEEDTFAGDEAGEDSALDAIREAEPELVAQVEADHGGEDEDEGQTFDAFDAFNSGVRKADSWGDVKQGLNALSRSDAWKAAMGDPTSTRIRQARIAAWCRVVELQTQGKEGVDMIADLTAFRCWVEHTEDVDAIMGNWQALCQQPIFEALTADQKSKLVTAIKGRVKDLQQPKLGV